LFFGVTIKTHFVGAKLLMAFEPGYSCPKFTMNKIEASKTRILS